MSLWSTSLADGSEGATPLNGDRLPRPAATSAAPLSSTTRLLLRARSIRPHVAEPVAGVALSALVRGERDTFRLPSTWKFILDLEGFEFNFISL